MSRLEGLGGGWARRGVGGRDEWGRGAASVPAAGSSLQQVCLALCDLCLLEWSCKPNCPFPRTEAIKSEVNSLHLVGSSNLCRFIFAFAVPVTTVSR